jgi:hypothetical protein
MPCSCHAGVQSTALRRAACGPWGDRGSYSGRRGRGGLSMQRVRVRCTRRESTVKGRFAAVAGAPTVASTGRKRGPALGYRALIPGCGTAPDRDPCPGSPPCPGLPGSHRTRHPGPGQPAAGPVRATARAPRLGRALAALALVTVTAAATGTAAAVTTPGTTAPALANVPRPLRAAAPHGGPRRHEHAGRVHRRQQGGARPGQHRLREPARWLPRCGRPCQVRPSTVVRGVRARPGRCEFPQAYQATGTWAHGLDEKKCSATTSCGPPS